MATENSLGGILSVDDAAAQLLGNAMVEEVEETDETETVEAEAETEEVTEEDEIEEIESNDDDFESEEAIDDDDTVEDDDTLEEIDADELEKGYLRQSDYTRKTQELATDRQSFDREREQFHALAQKQLGELRQAAETYSIPTEAEPDWVELAQTIKPAELKAQKEAWVARQSQVQEAAAIKAKIDEVTFEQTRTREAKSLLQRIPEWTDAEVQASEVKEIAEVASSYGISVDEIGQIIDHRQLALLRDLAIFKRSEKVIAQKSAKPKRRVRVGTAPTKVDPNETAKRNLTARLNKSGSPEDAAQLLLARATK